MTITRQRSAAQMKRRLRHNPQNAEALFQLAAIDLEAARRFDKCGLLNEVALAKIARQNMEDAIDAARALRQSRFNPSSVTIDPALEEFHAAVKALHPGADAQTVREEIHKADHIILNDWVTRRADEILAQLA